MSSIADVKAVTEPQTSHKPQRLILLVQMLVTAALLFFSFRGVDLRSALQRVLSMPFGSVLVCFFLLAVQVLLLTWRWHVLVVFFRYRARPLALLRGVLAERFVNQFVPSTIVGDSARFITLVGDGIARGPAFLSVLFDRVSGIIGIIIFGGLVSPLALIYGMGLRIALMPSVLAALTMLAIIAAVSMPTSMGQHIIKRFRSERLNWLFDMSRDLLRSRYFYQGAAALSILIQVLSWGVFVVIAVAVLGTNSLGAIAVCAAVVLLTTGIPVTIGGWGLRESASVVVLHTMGVATEDALGISILFGLIQLLMGLFAGLVLIGLQFGQSVQEQPQFQPEQKYHERSD